MICPLLSHVGLRSFEPLLRARSRALGPMAVAVDGGAGWGDTAKAMLPFMTPDGRVYAFEPFPGNHRFFADRDARVRLSTAALGERVGSTTLFVPRVVADDEAWAERGLSGYSSVGHVALDRPLWRRVAKRLLWAVKRPHPSAPKPLRVPLTRLDAAVAERHVDFVKLDLQGAELPALRGMGRLLAAVDLMWIEFSNQPGLLPFLSQHGFLAFDTAYLSVGDHSSKLSACGLRALERVALSTSEPATLAARTGAERDFEAWFARAKREAGVLQTDLVVVHERFLKPFLSVLGGLEQALEHRAASPAEVVQG